MTTSTTICHFKNSTAADVNHLREILASFSMDAVQEARNFHRTIPGYSETPLYALDGLARSMNVSSVWIKDESHRFGLNSFKVLGASYAVAYLLARKFGEDKHRVSFQLFQTESVQKKMKDMTLVAATDGNHGLAVSWIARQLGCRAVIYLPHGASQARISAIRSHGGEPVVLEGNYDDAVHFACSQAEKNGWIRIQDTALEESEETPLRIMQGYTTLLQEAFQQMEGEIPTHLFIQCGVGSLAGSMAACSFQLYGDRRPVFIVVEPLAAACYYRSIKKQRRLPERIHGDLGTIMDGLACGEASMLGWHILRSLAHVFAACSDDVAVEGMRILAHPLNGDPALVSGESGAVTTGLLAAILQNPQNRHISGEMELNENSKILLVSTEGK